MRARKKENRIRKSTKYVYIAIAICLIIASSCNLVKITDDEKQKTNTKQIYSYTNKFNYDYKVDLIPNKYIENSENKNIAYVTDLIDNINLNLNYTYNAQKESELIYEYEVIGRMQAVYIKDGEEQKILEKDEILVEKTKQVQNTNKIEINNNLKLNLKEKNTLLNEFKQKMGMTVNSNYTIILKVSVKTNVENQGIGSIFEPTVVIDLGGKTTTISGENNKEDTQFIAKKYQEPVKSPLMIIVDIVAIIISVYLLIYVNKAKVSNRVKNEYKYELNRILKLCQDKIVQVSSKPEEDSENIVYVKDFGEIIKVSEELFKPILYYFDSKEEEAWFTVMSNNVIYRYILKK